MTVETKYIAYDGEVFDSEEECLAHESSLDASPGMRFFDDGLKQMDMSDGAIAAAEEALFFVVEDDELATKFRNIIIDYCGMDWPSGLCDGQAWMFDCDRGEWVEVHSVIDSYKGILTQLGCS